MVNRILKVFLVLVLLSLPTSGQNSQQHLICKNVESVFSDGHDGSTVPHRTRITGSPGKRGPAGIKGERGMPGVQGIAGSPAIVNYDRIFQKIENKIRQELREMKSSFEECQKNVTELQAEVERMNGTKNETIRELLRTLNSQRCKEETGLPYNGKCYFSPYLSTSSSTTYSQAIQKCSSRSAELAEVHSLAQQLKLEEFFRSIIPSSRNYIYMYIGMTYKSSRRILRFRSGKEVSVDQFRWDTSFPSGSAERMAMEIGDDGDSSVGLWNSSGGRNGVICEKPL